MEPSLIESVGDSKKRSRKLPRERVIQTGERTRVVNNNGTITLHGVAFQVPTLMPSRKCTSSSNRPASRSSTFTARSASTLGPRLAPDTPPSTRVNGAANAEAGHRRTPNRHRCPETSTVTDVLIQNCHRSPETSHVAWEKLVREKPMSVPRRRTRADSCRSSPAHRHEVRPWRPFSPMRSLRQNHLPPGPPCAP